MDQSDQANQKALTGLKEELREFLREVIARDTNAIDDFAKTVSDRIDHRLEALIRETRDTQPMLEIGEREIDALATAIAAHIKFGNIEGDSGGHQRRPAIRLRRRPVPGIREMLLGGIFALLLVIAGLLAYSLFNRAIPGNSAAKPGAVATTSTAEGSAGQVAVTEVEGGSVEAKWQQQLAAVPRQDELFTLEQAQALCGKTRASPTTCRTFEQAKQAWSALAETEQLAKLIVVERALGCVPTGNPSAAERIEAIQSCLSQ